MQDLVFRQRSPGWRSTSSETAAFQCSTLHSRWKMVSLHSPTLFSSSVATTLHYLFWFWIIYVIVSTISSIRYIYTSQPVSLECSRRKCLLGIASDALYLRSETIKFDFELNDGQCILLVYLQSCSVVSWWFYDGYFEVFGFVRWSLVVGCKLLGCFYSIDWLSLSLSLLLPMCLWGSVSLSVSACVCLCACVCMVVCDHVFAWFSHVFVCVCACLVSCVCGCALCTHMCVRVCVYLCAWLSSSNLVNLCLCMHRPRRFCISQYVILLCLKFLFLVVYEFYDY